MQYTVIERLRHNNDRYAPGSTIELDETVAARLIESGTIQDPKTPVETKKDDLSKRVHDAKNGVEPKVEAPAPVSEETPAPEASKAKATKPEKASKATKDVSAGL